MSLISKHSLVFRSLPVILAGFVLSACSTTGSNGESTPSFSTDMNSNQIEQLHADGGQWQLESVDGTALPEQENLKPHIRFGTDLGVTGQAGCNRFFGQAELRNKKLRIPNVGLTMMMCPPPFDDIERKVSQVITDWSDVKVEGDALILTGEEHSLTYRLQPPVE